MNTKFFKNSKIHFGLMEMIVALLDILVSLVPK